MVIMFPLCFFTSTYRGSCKGGYPSLKDIDRKYKEGDKIKDLLNINLQLFQLTFVGSKQKLRKQNRKVAWVEESYYVHELNTNAI